MTPIDLVAAHAAPQLGSFANAICLDPHPRIGRAQPLPYVSTNVSTLALPPRMRDDLCQKPAQASRECRKFAPYRWRRCPSAATASMVSFVPPQNLESATFDRPMPVRLIASDVVAITVRSASGCTRICPPFRVPRPDASFGLNMRTVHAQK